VLVLMRAVLMRAALMPGLLSLPLVPTALCVSAALRWQLAFLLVWNQQRC
jgi:hypothetical protein